MHLRGQERIPAGLLGGSFIEEGGGGVKKRNELIGFVEDEMEAEIAENSGIPNGGRSWEGGEERELRDEKGVTGRFGDPIHGHQLGHDGTDGP